MGPLDEEEKEGLLVDFTSDKQEIYELEQMNIEKAEAWLMGRKLKPETLFSESFIQKLHKKMYGDIWFWAGKYRTTNKNIGVPYYEISMKLKVLIDDALYWYNNAVYRPMELAIRYKHAIVSIHCFPNGNGRHSRLMADLIMKKLYGLSYFKWGSSNLIDNNTKRKAYISALREADNGSIDSLIAFAHN